MESPDVRNVRIGRACSAAICEEIGVRLRIELAGDHSPLPQHLVALLDAIEPRIEVAK